MDKREEIPQAILKMAEDVVFDLDDLVDFSNDGRIMEKDMDAQYKRVESVIASALSQARSQAHEEAGLLLINLYRYDTAEGADTFNEGVRSCVQLLAPKSGTEPSAYALDDPPPISVHSDFDGNPMPTEWPDALSEIRGLRKDNERLAAQNQVLHNDLSRQNAFRGWSPQDRFTCWVNEGPGLAKEAGLYVGIKVSDAAIRQHSQNGGEK